MPNVVVAAKSMEGHDRSMRRLLFLALGCLLPAACTGPQSVLDPAGPSARSIHQLGLGMYLVAALVTLLVTGLMLVPFLRRRERRVNRKLFLWGGGVALPLLTLTALVPFVMLVGNEGRAPATGERLVVEVTGHQFWWEMSYTRAGGVRGAVSANELRLPVGEPVEVHLRSADVIHSLWVPNLAGKTDLIPGTVNRMVLQADRPGIFRGQCAEYCGKQHALMALDVIALPRAEFDAWLARLARPAREPPPGEPRTGQALFVSLGCGACHTVRGLTTGRLGPDLTQVGARRTIGAGTLPGGVGSITAWIAGAQQLKPGIAMPSFGHLEAAQLRALAAYLGSLE
jgi:cytochrome c oxidase subunit II